MAITDKTRKILWAKSGNRCSICHKELVDKISDEGDFIIGEECHIISSQAKGPRHKSNIENYDNYENLILLCRNHHKEIDSNVVTYTEELLRNMKLKHEKWVKETLNIADKKDKNDIPRFLRQITSGKELAQIISGAYGGSRDYDDNLNEEDLEFIAGVFQTLSDYVDIYSDLELYDQIKVNSELTKILKDIEQRGLYLFADRQNMKLPFLDNDSQKYPVYTIIIKKQDDEDIIKFDPNLKI